MGRRCVSLNTHGPGGVHASILLCVFPYGRRIALHVEMVCSSARGSPSDEATSGCGLFEALTECVVCMHVCDCEMYIIPSAANDLGEGLEDTAT